jgi:S1-C subfamily serine protease
VGKPQKLDPGTLVMSVATEGKRDLGVAQLAAVLAEEPPGASKPTTAYAAATVPDAAISNIAPSNALVAAARVAQEAVAPAAPDARMRSVVMVLNPKGSLGAGFYVDAVDVLTNFHVIEGARTIELRDLDGELFTGHVLRKDIQLDLALIRVERQGTAVQFANTIVKVGDTVEAIGHPKGLAFSLTRGIVSAVRQMKGTLAPGGDRALLIQTDTPINPGNSGGPLFLGDKVVGVNTLKFNASEGIGFALHYTEVMKFLSQQ